jgi:hypothetical protein
MCMAILKIDKERLHSLVMAEPLVAAGKQYGDSGSARLKGILRFIKHCARHATVHEKSEITVFALMTNDRDVDSLRLQHATAFQFGVTVLGTIESLSVEVREDDSAFVWRSIPPQLTKAIAAGIVYRLSQSVETLSVNGTTLPVPKVVEDTVSQFWLNYFTDLREALITYRDSMAKTSKCHLVREAWADKNRLWFVPEPEYRLRKSLANYLYSFLRFDEIDLREEQNVDDSHPVDIKVVWKMENRTAIIEVKWMGKSIDLTTGTITADYGDARARRGAKQLAEYLEGHKQQAAKEDTRGYLIVFDCRRKGLKPSTTDVDTKKGLHYQSREINFHTKFHKTRKDFDEPIRMFMEPVCV